MLTKKKNNPPEFEEDPPPSQNSENTFLFISMPGDAQKDYHFHFVKSIQAESYKETKALLTSMDPLAYPELIVVDIPLDFISFNLFRNWLKTTFTINIPLVYNESALALDEIKLLFSQKLVNDIIDLHSNYKMLPYKAKFIKKVSDLLYNQSPKTFKKGGRKFSNRFFSLIKRSIDVAITSIAILLLLPVFIAIAIAIKLETKGPVIYSANRAGKGFKVFKFLKFRTMIVDADKKIHELQKGNLYSANSDKPAFFKLEDDPRVTKVGMFLRNSSLDELPQLFNVLRGDMSIVGNRPLPLYEAASLTTNEWAERFMAPAGITGLWQVKKRGQKNMSAEERLDLDINYARNNNIARDLWIMAKTPSALMQKSNV